MLDPGLYDLYKTGDDRIDEDWIVQSNPPCAFKVEFQEGCGALLALLDIDPGMHSTKGSLVLALPADEPLAASDREAYLGKMALVVRTAERELLA
jgi:hypothetical protein